MRNKFLIGGAIVVAGGLLLLVMFSGTSAPVHSTVSVESSVSANAAQAHPAPDFTLQKLGGGTVSLSEFKGKKPVVVNFWASWCPNCRRDMPKLNGFYEKYMDKIEVIGINLKEKESVVQEFATARNISFPIAFDPSGRASNAFGIQYTNTHFLIDINGNLVSTIPGDIREADIVSLIEQTASETQSYLPDKKPCELASAEGGGEAGICQNET